MTTTEKPVAPKNAQREKVMEYALRTFLAQGVKSVTMSELAASLGMSKRTLYELFPDKEELLLAALQHSDTLERARLAEWAESQQEVVTLLTHAMLRRVEKMAHMHADFFADIMRYPKVLAYFADQEAIHRAGLFALFERGTREGYFRADIDYTIVCHLLGTQMRALFTGGPAPKASLTDTYRTIVLITLRGVTTPQGQQLIDAYTDNI